MTKTSFLLRALALCATLGLVSVRVANGGYTAWCKVSPTTGHQWRRHDTRAIVEPWQQAPLSRAQLDALGMSDVTDGARLLLGGKGSATIIGVPSGEEGGGCKENSYCTWMCQALCCLSKDCKFANQQTRERSACCDGDPTCLCQTEIKERYCYLHKTSNTLVKSNNAAVCEHNEQYTWPEMTGQCAELVQSELKMTVEQANYVASLGGTRRKLRALSGEDDDGIMNGWKPPKALREVNTVNKDLEKFEKKIKAKIRKVGIEPARRCAPTPRLSHSLYVLCSFARPRRRRVERKSGRRASARRFAKAPDSETMVSSTSEEVEDSGFHVHFTSILVGWWSVHEGRQYATSGHFVLGFSVSN